jgi:hypothetical protein
MSREQVELEDDRIACLTSMRLAGAKVDKDGGGEVGGRWGDKWIFTARTEDNLIILSVKKFKKAVDSVEEDKEEGSTDGEFLERRVWRVDQRFFGLFWALRNETLVVLTFGGEN